MERVMAHSGSVDNITVSDQPNGTHLTATELEKVASQSPSTDQSEEAEDDLPIQRSVTTLSTQLQNDDEYRIDPKRWCKCFRGYVRQDWHTVNVPDGVDELRAHWVELFFDLIYVACIVHLSSEVVYSLPDSPTSSPTESPTYAPTTSRRRLGSSDDSCSDEWEYAYLLTAFAQFLLLFQGWLDCVLYITRFVMNQQMDHAMRLLFMIFILCMGIFVKDSESYNRYFLTSYLLLKVVHVLRHVKVMMIPRARTMGKFTIISNCIIILVIIIILFTLKDGCALDYFWVYFVVYIFEMSSFFLNRKVSIWLECDPQFSIPIHVPHVAERFGLFVMLILGESLVISNEYTYIYRKDRKESIPSAASEVFSAFHREQFLSSSPREHTGDALKWGDAPSEFYGIISLVSSELGDLDLSQRIYIFLNGVYSPSDWIRIFLVIGGFCMSYMVGRLYYDCQPSEEQIMIGFNNHALRRKDGPQALCFFWAHSFLNVGLLGLGIGNKIAFKHLDATERIWIDVGLIGCSLVVITLSLWVIRWAHPGCIPVRVWGARAIILMIMVIVTASAVSDAVNQGVLFGVLFVCVMLQLVLDFEGQEQRQKEREELKERRREAEAESSEYQVTIKDENDRKVDAKTRSMLRRRASGVGQI